MSFMPIAVFHAELVCLGPLRCALALANAPVLHLLFLKLLLVSRPVGWELSGQVCTVRSQRIVSEEVRKNVKKKWSFWEQSCLSVAWCNPKMEEIFHLGSITPWRIVAPAPRLEVGTWPPSTTKVRNGLTIHSCYPTGPNLWIGDLSLARTHDTNILGNSDTRVWHSSSRCPNLAFLIPAITKNYAWNLYYCSAVGANGLVVTLMQF